MLKVWFRLLNVFCVCSVIMLNGFSVVIVICSGMVFVVWLSVGSSSVFC